MSYEKRRFKGPCQKCGRKSYRKKLCHKCYKEESKKGFHCTVTTCHRPIFATTLCRTHFKSFNSWCRIEGCSKHPIANGMCNYHYRRIKLPTQICLKQNLRRSRRLQKRKTLLLHAVPNKHAIVNYHPVLLSPPKVL